MSLPASKSSTDALVAGASAALLAVLRARRPDLTWEVGQIDGDQLTSGTASSRSVLSLLRTEDRDPLDTGTTSDPDCTDSAS